MFNGVLDKENPIQVSYNEWETLVKAQDRLKTLIAMVLECSTLNSNLDDLQLDSEENGVLKYVEAIAWGEYIDRLEEVQELYGDVDAVTLGGEPIRVKAVKLTKEETEQLSEKLYSAVEDFMNREEGDDD